MAKKDPTDLTVEERLKALYQLQTTLSAIDEKKALRGELPLEVQDLEDEIVGLTTRMEKIQGEIDEFRQAISMKKADIEEAKASIDRYTKQLDDVQNNRQYDTLTKEIEFQSLEIELCNKKIREANMRIEEREGDLQHAKELIDERHQIAKVLEMKIESRLLASFKRIRKNARNGLGIVYVQRDACGGCFNKIPPQRQLDIKMHKKVIVCEYCGRILVDPELAGVKIDKLTGEEKPKRKRAIRRTKKADDTPTED